MSEATCGYLLQSGYLKDIMLAIINECDGKDSDNIRLSLSLLEALFRHGVDTCKAVVDYGGLDFLLDVCKNHMEVSMGGSDLGSSSRMAPREARNACD